MNARPHCVVIATLVLSACSRGEDHVATPDIATADLALVDLAAAPLDWSVSLDLAEPPDLAAGPDLELPPDLEDPAICFQPMPPRVDFGKVRVGNAAMAVIKVRNACHRVANLSGVAIAGVNVSDFLISSQDLPPPVAVGAGVRFQIEVTFFPTALGARNAQLELSVKAAGNTTVPLTGTGI